MLFKVYTKNIPRPKDSRITEASEGDLRECFDKIFNEAISRGLIDTSRVDDGYREIKKWWGANHSISTEDYMIVDAKNRESIEIPNVCRSDTSIIFYIMDLSNESKKKTEKNEESKEKKYYNISMEIIREMKGITKKCGYKSEELSIQEGDFIQEIDDEDLEKYADFDSKEHAELMKEWEHFLKE